MATWLSLPALNGIGAASVRRFAASIGLTESGLRQSDWEAIPFLLPSISAEQAFTWELHTYAVYRVRTAEGHLWLFWLGINAWSAGELLPIDPQVVTHWQPVDDLMVSRCSHRACLNPALIWLGPAVSMTVEIFGHSHVLNFYTCGDSHRQALKQARAVSIELANDISLTRETISLPTDASYSAPVRQEISQRRGRLEGCPYDQWIFEIPNLWDDDEIVVLEAALRDRMQEYTDHFPGEYSSTFWRLSVSYKHQQFVARNGSNQLEAATAAELATAINQDYAAMRACWLPAKEAPYVHPE